MVSMTAQEIKSLKHKEERIGEEKLNNQDCLMKIVEYIGADNIVVEFQDEYKAKVKTKYSHFISGSVRNPYFADVFGVGILGDKYPSWKNGKVIKEYATWKRILQRCFDDNYQKVQPTYKESAICKEWLLYENFYEWLHNQPNFDKWYNGNRWALDKDILVKGNKLYSPETCCLVPQNVNSLFTKRNADRGATVIGVHEQKGRFLALCQNPFTKVQDYLGSYDTQQQAFYVYKEYKEEIIKQVAEFEYSQGNITEQCYEAMMNYEVEITD